MALMRRRRLTRRRWTREEDECLVEALLAHGGAGTLETYHDRLLRARLRNIAKLYNRTDAAVAARVRWLLRDG